MTRKLVFLAFAVASAAVVACGLLAPAGSPRADRFDCEQAALGPIFGDILDTKQLLRDLYAGKADLGAALRAAEANAGEVQELLQALHACHAPAAEPAPAADAGLESL